MGSKCGWRHHGSSRTRLPCPIRIDPGCTRALLGLCAGNSAEARTGRRRRHEGRDSRANRGCARSSTVGPCSRTRDRDHAREGTEPASWIRASRVETKSSTAMNPLCVEGNRRLRPESRQPGSLLRQTDERVQGAAARSVGERIVETSGLFRTTGKL